MDLKKHTRRDFLRLAGLSAAAVAVAACAGEPEVVEKIVKETVEVVKEVEKQVTVVVEKEAEATKAPEAVASKYKANPFRQPLMDAFEVQEKAMLGASQQDQDAADQKVDEFLDLSEGWEEEHPYTRSEPALLLGVFLPCGSSAQESLPEASWLYDTSRRCADGPVPRLRHGAPYVLTRDAR